MAPKDILTKKFLEKHYIQERKSVQTIAKEQGIKSSYSVTQAIKRHNLSRESVRNSYLILTKDFLYEEYILKNKSLKTIASEIGIKRKATVKEALIKHGFSVRKHSKSQKFLESCEKRRNHPYIPSHVIIGIKRQAKKRKLEYNVSEDYLWSLFNKQNGKCVYTDLNIYFNSRYSGNKTTASLDRIDSSKGYIEGNVQWVHKTINIMKWNHTEEDFIKMCYLVVEKNKKCM